MDAQEIRKKYLEFFKERGHVVIPRAKLVPDNDPTTLFTGSGMQPLVPYLLGEKHPAGNRLVDSQTCMRAQDIEEVGDNRHTTFFEMLGNWSLGDYFKEEQIPWFFEFLTDEIGLDPRRIFVTCFIGDETAGVPRDTESEQLWRDIYKKSGIDAKSIDIGSEQDGALLGDMGGRIFFYDSKKNWWSRAGVPNNMPVGEPGGPTTEMFYLYPEVEHDTKYGEKCHPNCDCGRYIELGNSVFMAYVKTENGVEELPKRNVDYGGGLERIAAASLDSPDVFKISVLWPIIEKIQELSGRKYDFTPGDLGYNTVPDCWIDEMKSMRVIADHLRGAVWLAVDGVAPSNKEQGYVARRLMRRAILKAFDLGIEQHFVQDLVPVIIDLYKDDFTEVAGKQNEVIDILVREEKVFRQTLRKGLREFNKLFETAHEPIEVSDDGETLADETGEELLFPFKDHGKAIFKLYDTYGFPAELSVEEANKRGIKLSDDWRKQFDQQMAAQRQRSQTATKGTFKGGLGGQTIQHKKYHTATHLMYQALRDVLGDHVVQHGSNITEERLRFDFSHPEKVTPEQIKKVEDIVNEQIKKDLKVTWQEYPTKVAREEKGALGQFGDRYGDTVKVYKMIADGAQKPFSFEICGGPHVDHTMQLAEGGKTFKIIKEQSSSAGIRRIKAVLV